MQALRRLASCLTATTARRAGVRSVSGSQAGRHAADPVAVITGGAKGIGRGCTEAFVAAGYKVACVDVDVEAGSAIAAATGGRVDFHAVDVSNRQAGADLIARVHKRYSCAQQTQC